jgi:hypothetical protein
MAWPSAASAAPNDGTVFGQVVNQSSGGGSTGGTNVILVTFGRKEQAPLGQQTTLADADGRYSFSGLDRDPNIVYLLVAKYASINYPSDTPFQLLEPGLELDLKVYESTSADDQLQLERLNLLVLGAEQGAVQFMQMGAIVNNGDRTYVTPNPQDQALARAVRFPLPKGALGVEAQSGFTQQDIIPAVGGFQITSPLLPGRHEFAFSFQLPYTGSSADLSLQLPYPTASYNIYLPNAGLRLDTSGLTASGSTALGGRQYALYSASNIAKATIVPSSLSGLGPVGTGLGLAQLALISVGVVLFVLGGGVVLLGWRGRPAAASPTVSDAQALEQERLELVVRMAALDERYAAGQVQERDYELERSRGKQRLRELLLQQRQGTLSS